MVFNQKIAFDYVDTALRLDGFRLESLTPLIIDAYGLFQMFEGPYNGPRKMGFFGDIHMNPVITSVYTNDAQFVNTPVLMTVWRGKPMRELAFRDNAKFDGIPVPIHENVLFERLLHYTTAVDESGAGGNLYYTATLAEKKPVFQFTGYYFNLNRF